VVFLEGVAARVVEETLPLRGSAGGRVVGRTASGDLESAADEQALSTLERCLRAGPFAVTLFDEKNGRFRDLHPSPRLAVIADELDGTRAFALGLPTCSTSLAALPAGAPCVAGNVEAGVIHTFDGVGWSFVRGAGVRRNGVPWSVPVDATALADARICFEAVNSGSLALLGVLLEAFEGQALNGLLSLASSAYVATKLVEGSCHLHLHLGRLLWDQFPELHARLRAAYPEGPPGQQGYDAAAALPLLWEARRISTDGRGKSLRGLRLDGRETFAQLSASNAGLHAEALGRIEERLAWMRGRAPELLAALFGAGNP